MAEILNLSGRADRIYYSDDTALVIDWKSGWREPEPAQTNAQLKVLAVLTALYLPHVTTVYVQIISGPYGVTEARYTIQELAAAYIDIMFTLRKINDPQAAFNPSPEACRFCPAVNICQHVKDLIKPIARLQHSALPDGERAAKLLDEVELLQGHLDEIRAHYSRRLEDPTYRIPGWALVPGAPRRVVADWVAARVKLEEFINANQLDALATFSVPKVEKLLGEAIGVKGEKLKEQLKVVLGDTLKENYPAPSLKRVKGQPALAAL